MMQTFGGKVPEAPAPSATVLFVRNGVEGVEVLMIERHHHVDFANGALVFPGGKAQLSDFDRRMRERCDLADVLSDLEIGVRVACLREAFEECGILLARKRDVAEVICSDQCEALAPFRERIESGEISFYDFLVEQDLVLLPDFLSAFAHWITPIGLPRRFDTYFYIVEAPRQRVSHSGTESVFASWFTPGAAISEFLLGQRKLLFPTRLNLKKLANAQSVGQAIENARASKIVTVCPQILEDENGAYLKIEPNAGYDETIERI